MQAETLRRLYCEACCEELEVMKPGNHSSLSKIYNMNELKFKYASTISSKFLTNKKLTIGEAIFFSARQCQIELSSNYNLGIIILCAPILKTCMSSTKDFKKNLKICLKKISKNDGDLILKSIRFVKPGGINKYKGKGNVLDSKGKSSFFEIMKIGSDWDRISKCYIEDYKEILDFGLPLFTKLKKKINRKKAIQILYMNFLSRSPDSHLQRKFGKEKASAIRYKAVMVKNKLSLYQNNNHVLKNFDRYLKKLYFNPGTCADLTVTTLLMDKIRDIFKIPL